MRCGLKSDKRFLISRSLKVVRSRLAAIPCNKYWKISLDWCALYPSSSKYLEIEVSMCIQQWQLSDTFMNFPDSRPMLHPLFKTLTEDSSAWSLSSSFSISSCASNSFDSCLSCKPHLNPVFITSSFLNSNIAARSYSKVWYTSFKGTFCASTSEIAVDGSVSASASKQIWRQINI